MDLAAANTGLVPAEMAFAHFNALRTAVAPDASGIRRESTPDFEILLDATRPASGYYNRAFARPGAAPGLRALQDLPREIVGLELMPAQLTGELAALLLGAGFRPDHSLCYLGTLPRASTDHARVVTHLEATHVDRFFDLLEQQGVAFPPDKRLRKRGFYATPQFQLFVAVAADGTDAAGATMFTSGGSAFFGNSYTLPQHRGTGLHRALLEARLDAAAAQGLAIAYTDVVHGSRSHLNCERAGFRTLTISTVWVRER